MSYRKEVNKNINEYLKAHGFAYKSKKYIYVRDYNDDIVQGIGFAEETWHVPLRYFMRTFITIASKSLNDILFEVSNGMLDYRKKYTSPAYFCQYNDGIEYEDCIHTIFISNKSMEDNIHEFDIMFNGVVQMIYKKYSKQKDIYLCPITDKYFNQIKAPCNWYYVPLAYFFNGEFRKAFMFIDERIAIENRMIERFGPHSSSDETISIYETYRSNLEKWIADKRQFKVDDEYLPVYDK